MCVHKLWLILGQIESYFPGILFFSSRSLEAFWFRFCFLAFTLFTTAKNKWGTSKPELDTVAINEKYHSTPYLSEVMNATSAHFCFHSHLWLECVWYFVRGSIDRDAWYWNWAISQLNGERAKEEERETCSARSNLASVKVERLALASAFLEVTFWCCTQTQPTTPTPNWYQWIEEMDVIQPNITIRTLTRRAACLSLLFRSSLSCNRFD